MSEFPPILFNEDYTFTGEALKPDEELLRVAAEFHPSVPQEAREIVVATVQQMQAVPNHHLPAVGYDLDQLAWKQNTDLHDSFYTKVRNAEALPSDPVAQASEHATHLSGVRQEMTLFIARNRIARSPLKHYLSAKPSRETDNLEGVVETLYLYKAPKTQQAAA